MRNNQEEGKQKDSRGERPRDNSARHRERERNGIDRLGQNNRRYSNLPMIDTHLYQQNSPRRSPRPRNSNLGSKNGSRGGSRHSRRASNRSRAGSARRSNRSKNHNNLNGDIDLVALRHNNYLI